VLVQMVSLLLGSMANSRSLIHINSEPISSKQGFIGNNSSNFSLFFFGRVFQCTFFPYLHQTETCLVLGTFLSPFHCSQMSHGKIGVNNPFILRKVFQFRFWFSQKRPMNVSRYVFPNVNRAGLVECTGFDYPWAQP
jgi:hypothetical protein